jgi:hypothetical protein
MVDKKKGFFSRFAEWQNYAHYFLLDLIVSIVASKFGAPIDLSMFLILYATIFIGDTLVHALFWFLPKPIRWRD